MCHHSLPPSQAACPGLLQPVCGVGRGKSLLVFVLSAFGLSSVLQPPEPGERGPWYPLLSAGRAPPFPYFSLPLELGHQPSLSCLGIAVASSQLLLPP